VAKLPGNSHLAPPKTNKKHGGGERARGEEETLSDPGDVAYKHEKRGQGKKVVKREGNGQFSNFVSTRWSSEGDEKSSSG